MIAAAPTRALYPRCRLCCFRAQFKKRLLTRQQELHHLKSSVEWQLEQGNDPGTKRFLSLFRDADTENRGYLTHKQFRMLLGERGLGLRINKRQEDLLIQECSDGRGAIEARNFCGFLAVRCCLHCLVCSFLLVGMKLMVLVLHAA